MLGFGGRRDPLDVRRVVSQLGRRERKLGWVRQLPEPDVEKLVARIESDLADNPTRDSLLEHLARLHFDTTARQRSAGSEDVLIGDTDTARCAVEAVIFERRYGVSLTDALGKPHTLDDQWDQANLYVEGTLRRLGIEYEHLGGGRWRIESSALAVYLHHHPQSRILDIYAPLAPLPAPEDREELYAELLAANGGSIAGAFYGICSFGEGEDHVCACARLATEHLSGPDVIYALNSVLALGERYVDER
jgi:hypothetical protein